MNCGGEAAGGPSGAPHPAGVAGTTAVCHGKNERSDHGGELVSPRRVRRVSRNPDLAVDSTEASPATNSTATQHTTANISVHHTKMSEVTAADRQIVFLDRARKLYSDGKFRPALAAFKEASF